MNTIILIVHVIVSLALILIVLLQTGKGAEMGASFGGSNQTVFGSRGSATFMSKVTTGAAVLFMVTSLSLAYLSSQRRTSIMKDTVTSVAVQAPVPSAATAEEEAMPLPADISTEPIPEEPAMPAPPPAE
jgi:preprotein translocase subunit SecG